MLDILFWVSVFTGGLMFVLLIFSLIGGLDFDLDLDIGGDTDTEGGGGLGIVKGVLTFISMSTWVIRLLLIYENSTPISIVGGIIVGIITVYLLSKLLSFLISQQEFNKYDIHDTINSSAKVYLKIPKGGQGLVHVLLNDSIKELKAKSVDDVEIATGSEVTIVDVEGNMVIVRLQKTK